MNPTERSYPAPGIGGTDYLRDNGGAATILNMAVNGLFATVFILGVGGELNGPTIGGIFTNRRIFRHWKTYPEHRPDHVWRPLRELHKTLDH